MEILAGGEEVAHPAGTGIVVSAVHGRNPPVVVVDPAGQPPPRMPSVGAANWAGGLAATEHLIGLGHERIAVIGGPPDVLCSRARVDGYRTAMSAAGLKVRAGYMRSGDL